jgi:hypothetical protein
VVLVEKLDLPRAAVVHAAELKRAIAAKEVQTLASIGGNRGSP